nr:MAG TPA: hypothetical protein [Caudoviricetes sp.]
METMRITNIGSKRIASTSCCKRNCVRIHNIKL